MLRAPEETGLVHPLRHGRRPRGARRRRRHRRPSDRAAHPARGRAAPGRRCCASSSTARRGSPFPTSRSSSRCSLGAMAATVDAERFLDDVCADSDDPRLGRLGRTTSPRGSDRTCSTGEAIAAIYEAYADGAGKPRWGDKTPMYMRHLALLERALSRRAVRAPRSATAATPRSRSSRCRRGRSREPGRIRGRPAQFACLWRTEVGDARVARRARRAARATSRCATRSSSPTPEAVVRGICDVRRASVRAGRCSSTPASVDVSAKPHQQRLLQPPTAGVRSWRERDGPADVARVRGRRGRSARGARVRASLAPHDQARGARRCRCAWYDARLAAWNAAAAARPALAALASPPPAALSTPDGASAASRPRTAMQPAVQREEVRALGRDARRVAAEREPPHDRRRRRRAAAYVRFSSVEKKT